MIFRNSRELMQRQSSTSRRLKNCNLCQSGAHGKIPELYQRWHLGIFTPEIPLRFFAERKKLFFSIFLTRFPWQEAGLFLYFQGTKSCPSLSAGFF